MAQAVSKGVMGAPFETNAFDWLESRTIEGSIVSNEFSKAVNGLAIRMEDLDAAALDGGE